MPVIKFNWKYFAMVFICISLIVLWSNIDKIMESKTAKAKMDVFKAVKKGNVEQVDSIIMDYIEAEIKKEDEK